MKITFDQIAIYPRDPMKARSLLAMLGLSDWTQDTVMSLGEVHGIKGQSNCAELAFNYDAMPDKVEFELLHYTQGAHWMMRRPFGVSHLGVHVNDEQLRHYRNLLARLNIPVAQEVYTQDHTNPFLLEKERKYHYVIFDTYDILGVDLKFIERIEK